MAAAPYLSGTLKRKAERLGYGLELVPGRRVKGWPEPSPQPFRLSKGGRVVASFRTAQSVLSYLNRKESN